MAEQDKDLSYSDFNPEINSTKIEDNLDISFSDFQPEYRSSLDDSDKNVHHNSDKKGSDTSDDHLIAIIHKDSMGDSLTKKRRKRVSFGESPELDKTTGKGGADKHSFGDNFDYKPTPSEIKEIFKETDEFLDHCLKKALEQEKVFISVVYRVYNMDSDVGAYKTLVEQQSRFIVNYSFTTQEYLKKLSETLPEYADFNMALEQTTDEFPANLPREAAEKVSKEILDCSHSGGSTLDDLSSVVKNINYWIPQRISTIEGFQAKQPLRLNVIEDSIQQLKKLVNRIILLKTQLHYLMMGESHRGVADYSQLYS